LRVGHTINLVFWAEVLDAQEFAGIVMWCWTMMRIRIAEGEWEALPFNPVFE